MHKNKSIVKSKSNKKKRYIEAEIDTQANISRHTGAGRETDIQADRQKEDNTRSSNNKGPSAEWWRRRV